LAKVELQRVAKLAKDRMIARYFSPFAYFAPQFQKNNMLFTEFPYQRPNMEALSTSLRHKLAEFENAASVEVQNLLIDEINTLRSDFLSMSNICLIRHTINVNDSFYKEEQHFFDSEMPVFEGLSFEFYQKLLASPFRDALEDKWGEQLFRVAAMHLKTFSPEILDDLRQENELNSKYVQLKGSAQIEFRGQTYNLSSILKLESDPDRNTRRAASEARWGFFEAHREEVDEIFHQLVQTRHRIAQKLGFENFIALGYARMLRSDYDAIKVAEFREEIRKHIVPLAADLYERQRLRLGIDALHYYDEDFRFADANAAPKGNPEWIVSQADRMYRELSPETHEFFRFMQDNACMDLPARDGKAPGGYCTFVSKHGAPFIFSNFNGTSADIDVLTHEVGHAFQVYSSRNIGLNDYYWPTYEACEIHSMSMEFFTWPWMSLFFEQDTPKYYFAHLSAAICFLPYGVAIDAFQHEVYEHPEWSPAQRHSAWRNIEQKYLPWRKYPGNDFLEQGGFWHKQSHVFSMPFYYIDYVLAQICALQFWKRDREDHQSAWNDYLRLCRAGGSKSFLELVQLAGLRSPFESGSVEIAAKEASSWLDQAAF